MSLANGANDNSWKPLLSTCSWAFKAQLQCCFPREALAHPPSPFFLVSTAGVLSLESASFLLPCIAVDCLPIFLYPKAVGSTALYCTCLVEVPIECLMVLGSNFDDCFDYSWSQTKFILFSLIPNLYGRLRQPIDKQKMRIYQEEYIMATSLQCS